MAFTVEQHLVAGQQLQASVQPGLTFQLGQQPQVRAHHDAVLGTSIADQNVLLVVGTQHRFGHRLDQVCQQLVTLVIAEQARLDGGLQGNLDVHLVVRGVDASGVVDRVGVDADPGQGGSDAGSLGQAKVAALTNDAAPQFFGVDPDVVVGPVTDLAVGLGGVLDVGTDAAIPEQVDRGPQNGLNQLVRGQGLVVDVQQLAHLTREWHRLRLSGPHPSPGADQRRVVVSPRRSEQPEQPLAFAITGLGVRARVEKNVTMVEGGHQRHGPSAQHAVAEDIPGHVPHPGHGEALGLGVEAAFAEVATHRLPRAAGGDAHRLVVKPDRAARGEGVTQPKAPPLGDLVGQVREGGGALVGGHHQVGVVPVMANDPIGSHHGTLDEVVADLEHGGDEGLVGRLALLQPPVTIQRRVGRPLGVEATLGPRRHDDRILDHLRLHQAQDLGAEVLPAVRPAQPTAGDHAKPQMDALNLGAVDEQLPRGTWLGCNAQIARGQLQHQRAGTRCQVPVGAQSRLDHVAAVAQDGLVVERGHLVEFGLQSREHLLHPLRPLRCPGLHATSPIGIETGLEQVHQQRRRLGVVTQHALGVDGGIGHSQLAQVGRDRPQHHHLAQVQSSGEHQRLQSVGLDLTAPSRQHRCLEAISGPGLGPVFLVGHQAQVEQVLLPVRSLDSEGHLVGDHHTQVIEQWQQLAQRGHLRQVELQSTHARGRITGTVQVQRGPAIAQPGQPSQVIDGVLDRNGVTEPSR